MLWLSFALTVLICLALVYLPGYLLFFGIGLSRLRALVAAPVASVAAYCVLGIVYSKCHIPCSWLTVALPVLVVCAILCALRRRRLRTRGNRPREDERGDWVTLAMYLGAGVLVGIYMLLMPLETPEAFQQGYDNAFHMNTIAAFLDSGSWSVLSVSKYLAPEDLAIVPLPGAGFYPALWHLLCALTASLAQCSVAMAVNVVNFVMVSFIYPASMMLLLSTVFDCQRVVRLGALVTLAFVGFPWFILYWGPLYANAFAFAFAPIVASIFIRIVDDLARHELAASYVLAFLLGTFVLVVAQTSAVFFCVALLAPYCVYRLWALGHPVRVRRLQLPQRACAVGFAAFTAAVWTGLAFSPFLHELVFGSGWPASLSLEDGIVNTIVMKFAWLNPQLVLATLVLVGIVGTLRQRQYLWITVAYLVFCVAYVLCVSTDGMLKHLLGGFWYTDGNRIPACLAIVGAPLAALGLSLVMRGIERLARGRAQAVRAAAAVVLVVLCVLMYLPSFSIGGAHVDTALGKVRDEYRGSGRNDLHGPNILLSDEEQAFVEKAMELVPEGELVVNMPDDGSVFAYALTGMRTYYRDYRAYDGSWVAGRARRADETRESKTIRKYGAWVDSNNSVREALRKVGARYVLVLDQGRSFRDQSKVPTYDLTVWTGIASIMDDTPGFVPVLSEGDMRLYEITALDEQRSSLAAG